MDWSTRYVIEKNGSAAQTAIGLLTPAAILAQPLIVDKINERKEKKRKKQEDTEKDDDE